jgi:hypothetical protein
MPPVHEFHFDKHLFWKLRKVNFTWPLREKITYKTTASSLCAKVPVKDIIGAQIANYVCKHTSGKGAAMWKYKGPDFMMTLWLTGEKPASLLRVSPGIETGTDACTSWRWKELHL